MYVHILTANKARGWVGIILWSKYEYVINIWTTCQELLIKVVQKEISSAGFLCAEQMLAHR